MNRLDLLEDFGRDLISQVRDEAIHINELIISGKMGGKESLDLYKRINLMSKNEQDTLLLFGNHTIDSVLHYFLWMIEQNDNIDLVIKDPNEEKYLSLKEISDGLCGELYSEDGWIEKFSKYPPTIKAEDYIKPSLEENIIQTFNQNPEEAKRYFVRLLNNKEKFEELKSYIPKIPRDIVLTLIKMTLARSDFHKEQCEELLKILNEK